MSIAKAARLQEPQVFVESMIKVKDQIIRTSVREGTTDQVPLFLMNGIGARLELLRPLVDRLDPRRTVITFDVPGVGKSPRPSRPYRLPHMSRVVGRLLDELGYSQVDVLGISWGGALAQQFAFTQSSRCRRLILVSTATGAIMVPAKLSVLGKMATPRRYLDPGYMERIGGSIYGGTARHDLALVTAANRDHQTGFDPVSYFMQLGAGIGWTSLAFLPLLRQPTLVLSGNDDPLIPTANAKMLSAMIRRSQLHVFDGGHLGLVTEADKLVPIIEDFLAS